MRFPVALALSVLCACASAPHGVPVAMEFAPPTSFDLSGRFQAEGEIYAAWGRSTAVTNSYGRYRVVGPRTNLSYTRDGKWGGSIGGEEVLLTIAAGRITGAGIDLTLTRDGDAVIVQGLWRHQRVDLTIRDDAVRGTPGLGCSLSLRPGEGTWWRGFLACPEQATATVRLDAAAGELPNVSYPQWLFAFLGTLPESP